MPGDSIPQEDIHLRQKIQPERDLVLVLMLALAFVMEAFAFSCVLKEQYLPAAIFHVIAFAELAVYARLKEYRERDARFVWMAVISLPVLGPVAPAGVLFALLWYYMSKEKSLSYEEWRESIFPAEHKSLAQTVYERIIFGRDQADEDYSITYLMDVIKLGTDDKKREAIFKISRHYDPSFAPLLKMALEDPHNVIRVQAATAMTKLKNGFFSESVRLEKLRRDWPRRNHLLYDLARHYDNYAFSGLLDETQEEENRLLALKYYQRFIEQEPKDSPKLAEVHQLYGRLLLRMNMVEEACQQFERLRAEGHATPDVNLWYCECLFYLRRYGRLREIAAENVDSPLTKDMLKYPDRIRGIILLWAGAGEGRPA